MNDVPEFIHKAEDIYGYKHFINDAGGSVCAASADRRDRRTGRSPRPFRVLMRGAAQGCYANPTTFS